MTHIHQHVRDSKHLHIHQSVDSRFNEKITILVFLWSRIGKALDVQRVKANFSIRYQGVGQARLRDDERTYL